MKELLIDQYFQNIQSCMNAIERLEIIQFHSLIVKVMNSGGSLYFMGNGGSATTANHFTTDFLKLFRERGHRCKVESLCSNTGIITALANDEGYENIFSAQLENSLCSNDLIVCISASGNSPNLIKALQMAKKVGAQSISIVGFDGGILKNMSDYCIHTPSPIGEYGVVEDCHMMINHMSVNILRNELTNERKQRPRPALI